MLKIAKCLCGRRYDIYSMYVGDQSECPHCRQISKQRQDGFRDQPRESQQEYFGGK